MHLLPLPKQIVPSGEGSFTASSVYITLSAEQDSVAAQELSVEWSRCTPVRARWDGHRDEHAAMLRFQLDGTLSREAYHLVIREDGIDLSGGSASGIYYGAQTLRQIIRQGGASLPCLTIDDEPDYVVRGFYHDISRGKVPSLSTLFMLIEKLAHYKINHLQLYIEHPFAFRRHPEIWAGSDPLTHDDIRDLQSHCQKYHIDFVPSLSTFGHCYRVVKNHRNQSLNELPFDATERPFSFRDAMTHYTLDCGNPESVQLMSELIREYGDLFSSRFFNICCDETFDLGKGKNAAAAAREGGVGALYAGYLRNVMDVVRSLGKTPMYWGDILLNHQECLPMVSKESVMLHWDYSSSPSEEKCRFLGETGRAYYVCSGVDGWRKCFNDVNGASLNILRLARFGKQYRASGFINTDWGDIGHINFLSSSYHGLVLGAAWAWHVPENETGETDVTEVADRAFARLEYGDESGEITALLREISRLQLVTWGDVSMWRDSSPDIPGSWRDPESGFPTAILSSPRERLAEARDKLEVIQGKLEALIPRWNAQDGLACAELRCSVQGVRAMLGVGLVMHAVKSGRAEAALKAAACADELRVLEKRLADLWHRRNRPSEYYRLRMDLLDAAEKLDGIVNQKHPYKGSA